MRWRWMVTGALAAMALAGCGDDADGGGEPGGDKPSAGGAYDESAYCDLVQEALDRKPPEPPGLDGELTAESAKALADAFSKELAFTQELVAAAPDDLEDEWQAVADAQATIAEQGRKFLDPAYLADFKAKSEDERAEFFFTEVLGPYADLDQKSLETVAGHAESACAVEGLFGVE